MVHTWTRIEVGIVARCQPRDNSHFDEEDDSMEDRLYVRESGGQRRECRLAGGENEYGRGQMDDKLQQQPIDLL